MKKNLLASLTLVFATAFVLADGNLGTATKVGSLSRSTDYVYTANETDTLLSARDNVIEVVKMGGDALSVTNKSVNIPVAQYATCGVVALYDNASAKDSSDGAAATPKAVADALTEAKAYADNAYTHPTYTARTGKPTANATPTFGGTFTVSQITSDSTGHVTGATDRTITIPSTTATTSAAGLMSAADKTALDSLSAGAVTKSSITAALQAQGITSADTMDDMDTLAAKVAAIIAVLEAID